jgi:hypothetical protein
MKIGYKALIEDAEKEIETLDLVAARALLNDPNVVFVDLRDVRERLRRKDPTPHCVHVQFRPIHSPYHKNVFSSARVYCQSWRSALAWRTVQRGAANVCHRRWFQRMKTAGAPVADAERLIRPAPLTTWRAIQHRATVGRRFPRLPAARNHGARAAGGRVLRRTSGTASTSGQHQRAHAVAGARLPVRGYLSTRALSRFATLFIPRRVDVSTGVVR